MNPFLIFIFSFFVVSTLAGFLKLGYRSFFKFEKQDRIPIRSDAFSHYPPRRF